MKPSVSDAAQRAWAVAFGLVLLDSLISYQVRAFTGATVPVNALVPVVLFLFAIIWGVRLITPPPLIIVGLGFIILGFSFGIFLLDEYSWGRFLTLFSTCVSFLVGYAALRWTDNADRIARLFLIVGCLYVIVCIIALLGIAPSYFPVVNAWGMRSGSWFARPEITTDQNFQIYYLLFVPLVLALPIKWLRLIVMMLATLGAYYILAKLQTRSGTLVLIGIVFLAWSAAFWDRSLGRTKLLVLPLVAIVVFAVGMDFLMRESSDLTYRFTQHGYSTLYGRVFSAQYLLEHILDPGWWIPQGNAQFSKLSRGGIPHFNPTAVFLEAGIVGLLSWILLFVAPLMTLAWMFFRRRTDALAAMVLVGGIASFVIQFSLNAPLHEHVWLWAGAVVGTLYRCKAEHRMPSVLPAHPDSAPPPAVEATPAGSLPHRTQ